MYKFKRVFCMALVFALLAVQSVYAYTATSSDADSWEGDGWIGDDGRVVLSVDNYDGVIECERGISF